MTAQRHKKLTLSDKDGMGKDVLLAEGYNLADTEIVYEKDWLDNNMVD